MKNVNLEKWRGARAAVAIDPSAVEFRAETRRGLSCKGCPFEAQWSHVCNKAAEEAARRGLPNCNDGYVYVAVERDPRQIALIP